MKAASSLILTPITAIYGAVTRVRLAAYQRGLLTVSKLPATVVSVGNLTTGGTGKTPLVEWICRAIAAAEEQDGALAANKLCVLTRGYGKDNPKAQVVVSNGTKLLAGERESGDEPFLLAENLLGVAAVISNPNRMAAGTWAIKQWNTEIFVLDDGLQHLQLSRDLNIVSIDATSPWGGGGLLPYGRLREPIEGLSRADCIVITRTEQVEDVLSLKAEIQLLVESTPIFCSRMQVSEIRDFDREIADQAKLKSEPIGAFCGVGNPESFFENLRREGYQLAFTQIFPDHHRYKQSELDELSEDAKANGARNLITTAKDAVKLGSLTSQLPCCYAEVQISIDDQDRLEKILRDAISKRTHRS